MKNPLVRILGSLVLTAASLLLTHCASIHAYKDEKQGLAYVGNEAAYQRYQQLATQQAIANEYRTAAEMNREAAYGWYGSYGPYVGYRPVVIHRR